MNLLTESETNAPLETNPHAEGIAPSKAALDEAAIILESVGVQYQAPSERYHTFKEYAIRWLQGKVKHRQFWALRDVNLTVQRGETMGIIGNNGAGKSTLLKLAARVLRPTRGRIIVRGQTAPLLEFGAGFHPELTGRENVYLNGAILGFSRQQMDEKFSRIVDFAELWDFIDAPVRTYSSGMVARLGFAVATDIEPDILLVDEVLSVGDEAFQHKSTSRMQSFRERGATILLVSHNMNVITQMCNRVAWLHYGALRVVGPAEQVIQTYRQNREAEQHFDVVK